MCGIAAIINPDGICIESLVSMTDALSHRGPDGYGFRLFDEKNHSCTYLNQPISKDSSKSRFTIGLGHRRLAIIDISDEGLQPMSDENERIWIVYNGEIYNYLELREELISLGYVFRTSSDTEVILNSYDAWGPECVRKFTGMWAFIIHDEKNSELFISRDRFGIKPLFYTYHEGSLYFASEIKSLLKIPGVQKIPNEQTVISFLKSGMVDCTEQTFFKGIYRFPQSHYGFVRLNPENLDITFHRYYTIEERIDQKGEAELIKKFHYFFCDSIKKHLRSDVSVGTCLSGGLDSSSIVSTIMKEIHNSQSINFNYQSVGYVPQENIYSEKEFMDEVLNTYPHRLHYSCPDHVSILNNLHQIITTQDEPFGSASILAQWYVFEKARSERLKVMLDGQGADEILGGYLPYIEIIASQKLKDFQFFSFTRLFIDYQKNFGQFPLVNILLMSIQKHPNLQKMIYLGKKLFGGIDKRNDISHKYFKTLSEYTKKSDVFTLKNDFKSHSDLKNQLVSDIKFSLPSLLRYEDRNSMHHGIEARVPFLDHELVNFCMNLPDSLIIHDALTKYVLREAMKNTLPERIRIRRDKMGFRAESSVTHKIIQEYYDVMIRSSNNYEERWFNCDAIKQFIDDDNSSIEKEFFLWRILNIKLWLKYYITN